MNVNPDLFQQDTSKSFTEKVFKNDFPGAPFKPDKARMRKGQHDKPPNYRINKEQKLCWLNQCKTNLSFKNCLKNKLFSSCFSGISDLTLNYTYSLALMGFSSFVTFDQWVLWEASWKIWPIVAPLFWIGCQAREDPCNGKVCRKNLGRQDEKMISRERSVKK